MEFIIYRPTDKTVLAVAWIEINTPQGNFVIQRGHAPMIITISPNKSLTYCLNNGKQETISTTGGIIEITREAAKLFLQE